MKNKLPQCAVASTVSTEPSNATGIDPAPVPDQPATRIERVQLSDGYSVTPDFFSEIRLHLLGRLPGLQPGCVYTAEQLAGKEFWALLDRGEQPLAGRCIAHMVSHQMLPLKFVEGKHEYPKLYRLE